MSTIQEPFPAPEPGVLHATRVLIQNIERQRDPETAAIACAQMIEQNVVIFHRRSRAETPVEVAKWMHRRVDKAMHERDERDPEGTADVKCTRGCSACCYQHVSLAEPEAKLALGAALWAGHVIDGERLRKQAVVDADGHQRLSHADRRCVMLKDDGDCAIYEHRPTACRTYRVISDPADCDTESNARGGVLALSTPMAEVVVSAAMQSFRYGNFAAFMLELTEGEQR